MTECKCLILKCGNTIDMTGKGYKGGKMTVLVVIPLLVHQVVIFIQIMMLIMMVLYQMKVKIYAMFWC